MPQPTWQLNGVWSYLLEQYDEKPPRTSFLLGSPLLFFLARSMERGKLGTPKTMSVFGGGNMAKGEIMAFARAGFRSIKYARRERNDGRSVRKGQSTPTASESSTDLTGRFLIGRAHYEEPYYLSKEDLDACASANDVRMQVEWAYNETTNALAKRMHRHLWSGGMSTSASVDDGSAYDMNDYDRQQESPWPEIMGLEYIVGTQNNIYGQKDRTTETALNPWTVAATDTGFNSGEGALAKLRMIDRINTGYTNASSTKVTGMAFRNANGKGIDLVLTDPDVFDVLLSDAASERSTVYNGKDVPKAPVSGFEHPVIQHGRTFIAPDPLCPANTMYCLSTMNCMFETSPESNFTMTEPKKKWELEEGGERKLWGRCEVDPRFLIDNPAMCGTITSVATS